MIVIGSSQIIKGIDFLQATVASDIPMIQKLILDLFGCKENFNRITVGNMESLYVASFKSMTCELYN